MSASELTIDWFCSYVCELFFGCCTPVEEMFFFGLISTRSRYGYRIGLGRVHSNLVLCTPQARQCS